MAISEEMLNKIVVVGDRVLIRPKTPSKTTKSGLYLSPTVQEKEEILNGYIIKVGPGYPIANADTDIEPWKEQTHEASYIPLQVKEGDHAVYLKNRVWEFEFSKKVYHIAPQAAILFVIREEI